VGFNTPEIGDQQVTDGGFRRKRIHARRGEQIGAELLDLSVRKARNVGVGGVGGERHDENYLQLANDRFRGRIVRPFGDFRNPRAP
jgi:hypothetical protein